MCDFKDIPYILFNTNGDMTSNQYGDLYTKIDIDYILDHLEDPRFIQLKRKIEKKIEEDYLIAKVSEEILPTIKRYNLSSNQLNEVCKHITEEMM